LFFADGLVSASAILLDRTLRVLRPLLQPALRFSATDRPLETGGDCPALPGAGCFAIEPFAAFLYDGSPVELLEAANAPFGRWERGAASQATPRTTSVERLARGRREHLDELRIRRVRVIGRFASWIR
jgi:hypothetical protein